MVFICLLANLWSATSEPIRPEFIFFVAIELLMNGNWFAGTGQLIASSIRVGVSTVGTEFTKKEREKKKRKEERRKNNFLISFTFFGERNQRVISVSQNCLLTPLTWKTVETDRHG